MIALGLLAFMADASDAVAQAKWPTRPVKFIVTLGAGADISARLFADRLGQRWGQR